MGVLSGKTKPFPALIISAAMRQRHNSWMHDATLQDCWPLDNDIVWKWDASAANFDRERSEGIITTEGCQKMVIKDVGCNGHRLSASSYMEEVRCYRQCTHLIYKTPRKAFILGSLHCTIHHPKNSREQSRKQHLSVLFSPSSKTLFQPPPCPLCSSEPSLDGGNRPAQLTNLGIYFSIMWPL